jgi:hypothetical protein
MLLVLSSCAVESHALARRDEVRRYRAGHPLAEPGEPAPPADPELLGPWRWGMTRDEVLAVTPSAWSDGDNTLGASIPLGASRGIASLSFLSGALVEITVVAPNQPGVEEQLRANYLGALGAGVTTCKGCDLKDRAVATGVANAIGATLLVVINVAAAAAGHHSGPLLPPLWDPAFPWQLAANADDTTHTVDWRTRATQAHLGVDAASVVMSARAL